MSRVFAALSPLFFPPSPVKLTLVRTCARARAGIVSLLFCGITLKHYAYHNMSPRTQRSSRYMFGSLASLSENFIFIYLGASETISDVPK